MGRELQKKKNRSSIPKVRKKEKSKKLNFGGNALIAANWDKKLTLSQNYRRMGLTSRLNGCSGGRARTLEAHNHHDSFAIKSSIPKVIEPEEAVIQRDSETGEIKSIVYASEERRKKNPLGDLLNEISDSDESQTRRKPLNEFIAKLEAEAASEGGKKPRKQSRREIEWIEALVTKYGDDTGKMFRDTKLNSMQQSEGDIRRRIRRWQEAKEMGSK